MQSLNIKLGSQFIQKCSVIVQMLCRNQYSTENQIWIRTELSLISSKFI